MASLRSELIVIASTAAPGETDFNYSAPLIEAVLLGTLAQRTGRPIIWDRSKMSALDVPEGDALLEPELAPEWLITV